MLAFRLHSLALVSAIVLAASCIFPNPAWGAEECAAVSGLWFDPALDGEGFNLLETHAGLVVTFYGYVNSGQRLWLISEVLVDPVVFDTDLSVAMLVGEGGNFQQPLPPAGLREWGNLSMNFSDSNNALFRLSGADGDKISEVIKLAGVSGQDCNPKQCIVATEGASRLSFVNDGNQGVFDPSLDAEVDSDTVWMSYSTVSTSVQWPAENVSVVHNRLAQSVDGGSSFSFVNEINPVQDVTVDLAAPNNAGSWVSEVSSLAYDAAAEPDQRWKLIWHHYLQIAGERHFEHGWLGYRTAAQPDQLKDATEIKLFGAGIYDPINNATDGVTQAPVGGAPLIDIRDLDPELADCAVLSEPGWLSDSDALYLAVGCFQINPRENRMILLACAHPCAVTESGAWRFVATLLVNANARVLGFESFSAPDLFVSNGATYLWISTGSDFPYPDSYNGCRAFRFTNLAGGVLQTDAGGQPTPILILNGLPGTFNGACALHSAAGKLAFYSQLMVSDPDHFQIFRASTESCFSAENQAEFSFKK